MLDWLWRRRQKPLNFRHRYGVCIYSFVLNGTNFSAHSQTAKTLELEAAVGLKDAELLEKTAEIRGLKETSVEVMDRLVEVSDMMYNVNRNTDVNSPENFEKLKQDVAWIVERSMPGASYDEKSGYKRHIFSGIFTAISKAYQFDVESKIPRDNTFLVMGTKPQKRSRKGN